MGNLPFLQDLFVEVDIVMAANTPLSRAHDLSQQLQDKIELLPGVARAFVHVDHEATHRPVRTSCPNYLHAEAVHRSTDVSNLDRCKYHTNFMTNYEQQLSYYVVEVKNTMKNKHNGNSTSQKDTDAPRMSRRNILILFDPILVPVNASCGPGTASGPPSCISSLEIGGTAARFREIRSGGV